MKTFDSLYAELVEKAQSRPAGSLTVAELDSGGHGIGKKVVEEAAEVWMAAEYESKEAAASAREPLLGTATRNMRNLSLKFRGER